MKKLTEKELIQQYYYRASCVADLIGKWHGSGDKKITQRVLKEPNRWTIWAMSLLRPLIPSNEKRHIRWTPLLPIAYVFSFAFVFWVRYIEQRRFTLKQAEDYICGEVKNYLETDGQWLLDMLSDPKAVVKYDRRISLDAEYTNPENIKNESMATVATALLSTPLDSNYPRFTVKAKNTKRWQQWLGLTPTDSVWRVMWKAFKTGWRGGEPVKEINAYFTARRIVREHGYDKGKGKDAIKAGIKAGVVQVGRTLEDEEGDATIVVPDVNSGREYDLVDNTLLVEQLFDYVTDPVDSFALRLQYEAYRKNTTIEAIHHRHLKQCQKFNLNTPSAIRKRIRRLPVKYSVLNNFKPI